LVNQIKISKIVGLPEEKIEKGLANRMKISNVIGLPEDEVELREGEHEDAQEGRDGAVDHRGEHRLQGQHCAPPPVTQASNKALEGKEKF